MPPGRPSRRLLRTGTASLGALLDGQRVTGSVESLLQTGVVRNTTQRGLEHPYGPRMISRLLQPAALEHCHTGCRLIVVGVQRQDILKRYDGVRIAALEDGSPRGG